MQDIYEKVAKVFADRINTIFESEATLEAEFKRNYETLPFDRTDYWSGIIYNVLRDAWLDAGPDVKAEPTGFDRIEVLRKAHKLLDYNLFTQVLLNLQGFTGMAYQTGAAEKEIARMQEEWKAKEYKLDPFAPKAKMVKQAEVATEEQKSYNTAISSLRALRIISKFNPDVSFRVSPKGKTPAFADSRNLSMLGEGGDKYLKTLPQLGVWYLTWTSVPRMATAWIVNPPDPEGMEFRASGIPYPFKSKSGGEVLHDVLFARRLMYDIFAEVDTTQEICIMIPRMNSLLIVADKYGTSLKKAIDKLKEHYPMLTLVEGARA